MFSSFFLFNWFHLLPERSLFFWEFDLGKFLDDPVTLRKPINAQAPKAI